MARDGSSGGIIRLAIIDKNGFTRFVVPGNQLPAFSTRPPFVRGPLVSMAMVAVYLPLRADNYL